MMKALRKPPTIEGAAFACSAAAVILVLLVAIHSIQRWVPLPNQQIGISLTLPWLATGIVLPLFILLAGLMNPPKSAVLATKWIVVVLAALAGAYVLTVGFSLAAAPNRKFLLVVAAVQTWIVVAVLVRGTRRRVTRVLAAFVAALVTWAMTAGLPYIHLNDWLLNATGSSGFAVPAAVAALVLVVFALGRRRHDVGGRFGVVALWVGAVLVFLALGFRTDNETATWIPYHQSYFTSPASLVREHHWLLWDVPSQYGFLSILALAVTPGRTIFDSLHVMTAMFLLAQALMIFAVFRYRRPGLLAAVVGIFVIGAALYSSQTSYYPFGARLYPQEGLRFIWPMAVVFCAFLRLRTSSEAVRGRYLTVGYAVWIIGILWSFETGAWTTITWVGYLAGEALTLWLRTRDVGRSLRFIVRHAVTSVAALLLVFGGVELVYFAHFHHGPDWVGFSEFSAIYTSSAFYAVPVAKYGAGWALVAIMIGIVASAVYVLRARRYDVVPVLAGSWAALWATSSYYIGESYDSHVASLTGVMAFTAAVVVAVTERGRLRTTPLLARLSLVPFFVVMIGYAVSAPAHMHDAIVAATHANPLDISQSMPPISGELRELERRAGMSRADRVLYPNSIPWVKISTGLILPLERADDGSTFERQAWLPESPTGENNAFLTLSLPRRNTYVERYLDDSTDPRGWLITYRVPADCAQLSPRLIDVRRAQTRNYNAVYCTLASGH